MAVTIVTSGSQIGVELMRNVAKVNFSFFLTEPMRKAYDEWDIVLNTIPPASFYIPQAYEAPFPELQITDPYYSRVLGVGVASPGNADTPLLVPAAENLYLPVNLQYSVPGTVVSTRYLNAPVFATSLQLLGKKTAGSSITQTVVYMIPLGANFTDDYSIRPNNAINYRITLVSDSPDDSSVVKFIAGKFAGKFEKYQNPADNSECWGYTDELEDGRRMSNTSLPPAIAATTAHGCRGRWFSWLTPRQAWRTVWRTHKRCAKIQAPGAILSRPTCVTSSSTA